MLGLDLLELDGDLVTGLIIDAEEDLSESAAAQFGTQHILIVHDGRVGWIWLSRI